MRLAYHCCIEVYPDGNIANQYEGRSVDSLDLFDSLATVTWHGVELGHPDLTHDSHTALPWS